MLLARNSLTACSRFTNPACAGLLRHQRLTLTATIATIVLTSYLYVLIPKGFFPAAGPHEFIVAVSELPPQDVSSSGHAGATVATDTCSDG